MFLHGLSFLSSMFIHQFIWSSPLSFLWCLMTLCWSCLPEMLSVSPRLVDCGLLWKVKLDSWTVWFRCHCHGRFPLFPLGCPFCFLVSGFPRLCKFLVDRLVFGIVHSIVPSVLETSPESETPAGWEGRCDNHPARGREGLDRHMLLK